MDSLFCCCSLEMSVSEKLSLSPRRTVTASPKFLGCSTCVADDVVEAVSGSGEGEVGDWAILRGDPDEFLPEFTDSFFGSSVLVNIIWMAYI